MERLYSPVRIPQAVLTEVARYPLRDDYKQIAGRLNPASLFQVVPDSEDPQVEAGELGPGETAALSIAKRDGLPVLLDDLDARVLAKNLNLPVIGTLAILVLAKRRRLIDEAGPPIKKLRESGYFVSAPLVREVLAALGET